MNVSMLELQGQLATSTAAPLTRAAARTDREPSAAQPPHARDRRHPRRRLAAGGRAASSGASDDGCHRRASPSGANSASLLRCADTYTAKLSPRRSREALSADVAARMMFAAQPWRPGDRGAGQGIRPLSARLPCPAGLRRNRLSSSPRRTGPHPVGRGHHRRRRRARCPSRCGATPPRPMFKVTAVLRNGVRHAGSRPR